MTYTNGAACEAAGFSNALDACAEVLLDEPTETSVSDLRAVAGALGIDVFDGVEMADELRKRYSDRLFVAVSPFFVPLQESCVLGASTDAETGAVRYGSVQSSKTDHVAKCYAAVGFDLDDLGGRGLGRQTLRLDSAAAELAFLAFLKRMEADDAEAGNDEGARHIHGLAARFAREHPARWLGRAAKYLSATEDDLYAKTVWFASELVGALAEDRA